MITRYSPFKDLIILKDEINRAFDENILKNETSPIFTPKVDISEDEFNLTVKAELTGIQKDNIQINATNESLVIS